MPITVREIHDRSDIRRFVDLPWTIYKDDRNWVPPLKSDMWSILTEDNPLFECGPHALFLAEDRGRVVGRVMAAIDEHLNEVRGRGWGYFSLFESEDDPETARSLLEACERWLRERGCRVCRGPVSPDNGDDRLAYYYKIDGDFPPKAAQTVAYAKSRWKFRVDRADLGNLESEFASLKAVVDAAMPEWPDMIPPTMDEMRLMAKKILPFADADFIYLARSEAGEPIGFLLGLPDYNQALKYVNGSLFPFGWAKFLWHKRKIDGIRVFVLFVVPAWQRKAVSHAMFYEVFQACRRKGYRWAEGSTIVETNGPMNRDAVGAGGVLYKKYRTYEKLL